MMQKKLLKSLSLSLMAVLFLWPNPTFAISDLSVLQITSLKKEVSQNEEIDFIVSYGNRGSSDSAEAELIINYNENELQDLSLGNKKDCQLNEVTIRCLFKSIPASSDSTISFTAKVNPSLSKDAEIITSARIIDIKNPNDPKENNRKESKLIVSGVSAGVIGKTGVPIGLSSQQAKLKEPAKSQGVAIFDVSKQADWKTSGLSTAGLKFMIRGKEALAWTLGIKNQNLSNPAIQSAYLKVLTVVNSLFIIGLLIIAGMWMFSLVIPRSYLKKVILVYGLAVILVNFAFPFNQLLIEGSQLLQRTFMSDVQITQIVQLPNYHDKQAIAYLNEADNMTEKEEVSLQISVGKRDPKKPAPSTVAIGELKQDFLKPTHTGSLNTTNEKGTIELKSTGNDPKILLKNNQQINLEKSTSFNPQQEQSLFVFGIMAMTGLAYLLIALLLIFRMVILWALLIVSPVLFLLVIFKSTRSYFSGWASLYLKWLLIGPLLALAISLMVGIWQSIGIPIASNYISTSQFGTATNIGFYLPGKDTVNTLSTTSEMMEYIIFLIMLYIPLLFAFMLTRQKIWESTISFIGEKGGSSGINLQTLSNFVQNRFEEKGGEIKSKNIEKTDEKISKITQRSIPEGIKEAGRKVIRLSENEKNRGIRTGTKNSSTDELMNEAKSIYKGARHAHSKMIEGLANPSAVQNSTHQEKLSMVRSEIEKRAKEGDTKAGNILKEIQQVNSYENITNNENHYSNDSQKNKGDLKSNHLNQNLIEKTKIKEEIEKEDEKEEENQELAEKKQNHNPSDQ